MCQIPYGGVGSWPSGPGQGAIVRVRSSQQLGLGVDAEVFENVPHIAVDGVLADAELGGLSSQTSSLDRSAKGCG